jgi:glutamine synthetase
MSLLADIGVPVKYGHSEVGYVPSERPEDLIWEQHEIELSLQPLPRAAEAVVLTAWVLRNLAHKAGMRCSFDPIVKPGHAGSGLHFHMSPVVDGEHRGGVDDEGNLGTEGRWLVGGLARLGGALMAFGNTEPGSFVRLTQGKEAPNTVTWGRFNRKVLIRLPVVARDPDGRIVTPPTIEFRLPDGSAQPHLLLAGIAQGLVLGSKDGELDSLLEETRATAGTKALHAEPVPRDFDEVAQLLDRHRADLEAGGVFPSTVVDRVERVLQAKAEATPAL